MAQAHEAEAFLASATPAAGKTTFGLRVAHHFLSTGRARRVAIVAPTAHICRQWAADAARYGIDLEPNRANAEGPEPRDRHGLAVTYQAVAADPKVHAQATSGTPTLLIADEPHHMGEHAAWGATAKRAFGGAGFRLLLSGTPFRSDNAPIPWVVYDEEGISKADFAYSYTEALRDRVCRPITFLPYDGDMEWVSNARTRHADFGVALPAQESARRLRTALQAEGDWMTEVLRDADAKLTEIRAGTHPDAGGLVVAADKEHAHAIAQRLHRISGAEPAIVTSDDPQASQIIARHATNDTRWLVSVLMVSEGVDIPRLRVGVYATPAKTELFFRQVVGRFIRRTPAPREQTSYLFMPADPQLKVLATTIEEERNHALTEDADAEGREQEERAAAGEAFEALTSTGRLDEAIEVAPGENFSLFGEAEAKPTSKHLEAFGGHLGPARTHAAGTTEATYSKRERLRAERSALVARVARRIGGSHGQINGRINRAVGAESVAKASVEQLERGNALLARELG